MRASVVTEIVVVKMSGFLKKHWLIFLLFILATAVVFFWYHQKDSTPKRALKGEDVQIQRPSTEYSVPSEGNIKVDVQATPSFPSSVDVFKTQPFNEERFHARFARLFSTAGLNKDGLVVSENPLFVLFQSEQASLLVSLPSGKFSFQGEIKIPLSGGTKESVVNFVKQLKLVDDIALVELEGVVVAGDELRDPEGGEKPNAYIATIFPRVGSLSVLGAGEGQQPLVVKLFADGVVFGISLSHHLPGELVGNLSLIPYPEAAVLVESGRGEYLWIRDQQGRDTLTLDRERLEKTSLTSVGLFYFESGGAQDFLQPVYIFTGTAETASGAPRRVALMVPAVEGAVLR